MKKIILLGLLSVSGLAFADNGVFAINDVCDGFGCFPGDSGGFPITITNAGSYQLTSNLISSSTTVNVIEINANNVTLDLNGFSIIGPKTCTGLGSTLVCNNSSMTANGIASTNALTYNSIIKNGTIEGFSTGIDLGPTNSANGDVIKHVTLRQNGIGYRAPYSLASDVSLIKNSTGFIAANSLIKDSYILGNKFVALVSTNSTCSNVYVTNDTGGVLSCSRFTNQSTCDNADCP